MEALVTEMAVMVILSSFGDKPIMVMYSVDMVIGTTVFVTRINLTLL